MHIPGRAALDSGRPKTNAMRSGFILTDLHFYLLDPTFFIVSLTVQGGNVDGLHQRTT